MNNITPGKWERIRYKKNGIPSQFINSNVDGEVRRICIVPQPGQTGYNEKEVDANAKLITAAPELLKFAEDQLLRMDDDLDRVWRTCGTHMNRSEFLNTDTKYRNLKALIDSINSPA